jgi:PAS domain S-box-containing protein
MSERDLNRQLEGLFSDLNDPQKAVEPPDLAAAAEESPETEEQMAALRTLRESEQKFRTLYEGTSDAVMLLDERSFFDCNPATLEVFGCTTKEQFLGRHPSEFSPPLQPSGQDSISLSQQRITTALQEGSCRFEWLHCRLDGSEFPAEVWLTSMEIGGNKVLQAVVRDITERKRAEEALRESEERLRSIVEHSHTSIFMLDNAFHIIYANTRMAAKLGYSMEELLSLDFREVLTEESLRLVSDRYVRRQRGEKVPERYEMTFVRKDGERRYGEVSAAVIKDAAGNVRTLCQMLDITERKQAEEALRASEERYRLISELILDYAYAYEVEPDGSLKSSWITDDSFTRLTGYAWQETGSTYKLYHPEDAPLAQKHVEEALRGQSISGEYRIITKSGELRWLHIRRKADWDPLEKRAVRLYGVAQDITERKQAEEQMHRLVDFQTAILNNAGYAVIATDTEGVITAFNPAAERMLGYRAEEFIGKATPSVFHDLDEVVERAKLFSAELRTTIEPGFEVFIAKARRNLPNEYEWTYVRKDGSRFPVLLSVTALRNPQGDIIGFLGLANDITALKRLERAREEMYERRARQVQISTQVAQEIAAAPGLDELFRRMVTLIKERFGYYHAQIFRYEPNLEAVILVPGYGEAGRKMLAKGYRLGMGQGVVGTAAATGQPVLVNDIAQDKDWTPNPDLPETKAELAVPIKLRDQVLGILDVQSDQLGALTEDDQLLLEGLCGQIAIAIEDIRLRQEMEERLHELDSTYRAMSREGWETFRRAAGQSLPSGYLFDRVAIRPADDLWTPEMKSAVEQDALVPPVPGAEASTEAPGGAAVAPLSVRGEMVGVLGIFDDPQQPLSQDDLALVESVSEQVALALESARLFQQTQTALSESENLYQISAGLNAARTYEDILAALRAHTVMGEANQSGIFLFSSPWEDTIPEKASMLAGWGSEEALALLRQFHLRDLPVAEILRRDEPVWAEDILKDDRFNAAARTLYAALDTRSAFFVPLVAESRWIGFLSGGWQNPTSVDPASLRLLMAMAGQAAVAVQNMQRLQEIQVRVQREQALREIVATINASENLGASLPIIDDHVRELIPISFSALATHTPGEHECVVYATGTEIGTGDAAHGIRVPLEGTGAAWVIAHAEPWLDADMRARRSFAEDDRLTGQGIVSRAILPLQAGERVVGAYTVGSQVVGAFTEDVVLVLDQIADQMALVLERARLMAETRAALAETEAVYRRYLAKEWGSFLGSASGRAAAYIDSPAGLASTPEISMPEIEQVIASGEPVILNEAGNGEDQPTPRAAMAMPIRLRGQTIGVLDFYQEGEDWTWTDEERALVETLADQAALALENARLFTETRESAQRMRALYETSRALSSALEQEAIIRTILEAIHRAMGCEYLTVSLVDEQAGEIETRHGIWQDQYDAFPEWIHLTRYPLGHHDILADVYRSGRTEVVSEWDDRFDHETWTKFEHERLLRIYMPLKVHERVLGVIEVGYDKQRKGQIDEEEIQTLAAFVDQAAVALENANLLQQAQRRAWRERLAREIGGKLQAAPDIEAVLQTAVRELGRVMSTPRSFVQLGETEQGRHQAEVS